MPRQYDWDSIERDYVEGVESIRELSRRLKMSDSTLLKQSTKRDWVGKRAAFRGEPVTSRKPVEQQRKDRLLIDLADLRAAMLRDLLWRAGVARP